MSEPIQQMFRTQYDTGQSAFIRATFALIFVIVGATGVTGWLIAEVRKEQHAVKEILRQGDVADIARLGTLPGEMRWQFILTVLVLLVLAMSAIALFFIAQAYVTSQASLRNIKMLAWDILASTDQGVITTDCDGRITSVNPRGDELLGLEDTSVGRPIRNVCGSESPLFHASQQVLQAGVAQTDLDFSMSRNGHEICLRAECHVLRGTDESVLGTVFHIRDVTERMLIEDRIQRMERFMGLGTLASGLHHEIKNPLSALSLHVQLLEERLDGQVDDEVAENLGVLKTEVTRIAGVLESFGDYAASDRMNMTPTDLGALLQQTVELMRPKAEQQGVRIELNMLDQPLPQVKLDSVRFEQVLLNLVINALDELHDGGKITLSICCPNNLLRLEIADTGPGIPDNIRPRIFDPYFTTKSGGSGMGLAFSDKIVRQHGGELDLDTTSARTVFRISLPTNDE